MRSGEWRRAALQRERLMVIVGPGPAGRSPEEIARAVIAGGARLLELRWKGRPGGDVLRAATVIAALCEAAGALLIVNDDAALAVAAGADGVHVGQGDVPPEAARAVVGRERLVGLSVHDAAEAVRARGAPVDYVGLGTVFSSALKPDLAARGPAAVRALLPELRALPGFAIGGITAGNVGEVLATGVHGVAVGSAIVAAPDPEAATREMLEAILKTFRRG